MFYFRVFKVFKSFANQETRCDVDRTTVALLVTSVVSSFNHCPLNFSHSYAPFSDAMKSIVSIQDMTEELSSEKTMTNSEDVAETETSVLVPSPKQNDAKDEGQPMDICVTKEETPTERESGNEMTLTNGSITGEEIEDKSNDATDENSNSDVNSNVEAAKEDQNGTEAATSGTETATSGDEVKENPVEEVPSAGKPNNNCTNEEIKDKIDEVEASKPPGEKWEEANADESTKESTTETASESTNTNDDTMGSTSGDGSDDFVNAIEEQLEKVVQEEKAVDLPEDEPADDRPESEKVVSFVMDALFGSAMEQVATKAVYDEALSKLNIIAQSNRRLLDEDLPGIFDLEIFSWSN